MYHCKSARRACHFPTCPELAKPLPKGTVTAVHVLLQKGFKLHCLFVYYYIRYRVPFLNSTMSPIDKTYSTGSVTVASTGTLDVAMTTPDELDMDLSEGDIIMVQAFEASWKEFMAENPSLIPLGKKRDSVLKLQRDILSTLQSKQAVETELVRQLEFFQQSRDNLEQHYGEQATKANIYQSKMHDTLQEQLDKVYKAKSLAQQTISWNHFLNCLDKATPEQLKGSPSRKEKSFKPSARAMALVDPTGDEADVQLRAYRLDHAILTAQVKMLDKELEKQEMTTITLEAVGKLLSEHNIWGLLTKQQQDQGPK